MITATIRDVLDESYRLPLGYHWLYLVRDGDTIFYVGMSQAPAERLLNHMGRGSYRSLSTLGKLINDNMPSSLDWQVEYLTLKDCEPIVLEVIAQEFGPLKECATRRYQEAAAANDYDLVDVAERALIDYYRPCLNTAGALPRPLPARYLHARPDDSSARYLAV